MHYAKLKAQRLVAGCTNPQAKGARLNIARDACDIHGNPYPIVRQACAVVPASTAPAREISCVLSAGRGSWTRALRLVNVAEMQRHHNLLFDRGLLV